MSISAVTPDVGEAVLIASPDYLDGTCPDCLSDNTFRASGSTACGVETFFNVCELCGNEWGHE